MPYIIKEFEEGYKVCKKDGKKCFSKDPIPLKRAIKQRKAIGMMSGGQTDADTVKGLSGAIFDVAESIPGFGTALSVVSPLIKTGLNKLIDFMMNDPEAERREQNKRDWAEYIRETSLQKYGQELTPEEYRYVQFELKKRRMAKMAQERAEAIARDQKRAEESGFKTIGEFSRAQTIQKKSDLTAKAKEAGFATVRDYQQARKRGEVSAEQRKIVEGRGKPKNPKLYEQVKKEIYEKNPKHSLFRSAMVVKEYKKRGGKYEESGSKPLDIKKWFKQRWITLNDYIRGKIVDCGDSDTQKKYDEYPLCRPIAIAKKLGNENIKKMIEEKNKLEEKQLRTEDVLGTDEFNIKPTLTGTGSKDKFFKQLDEIGLPAESYLDTARRVAKREGYDPTKLSFAMNNDNKLKYDSPEGVKYFGKAGYGDFLIWSFKERNNEVPKGYAKMKRNVFRKSHGAISEIYNLNKFSPNELALAILW